MPVSFKIVWSLEGMKLNGIPAVLDWHKTMAQDHGTKFQSNHQTILNKPGVDIVLLNLFVN